MATFGVVLPSFLVITIIAAFFSHFQDEPVVMAAFQGIRPAVAALMVLAVWKVGKTSIQDALGWIIATISFILVVFFSVHAIFAILGAALLGIILHFLFPRASAKLLAEAKRKGEIKDTEEKGDWE